TKTGTFSNEVIYNSNSVELQYIVDADHGDSGAPIMKNGGNYSIGVHSAHLWDNYLLYCCGFEENDFENAVNDFAPSNYIFVDNDHPSNATKNGTVFRPYTTVANGVSNSSSGDVLSIAEGGYPE